jgi:ATP-dependent DNA helicase DinG
MPVTDRLMDVADFIIRKKADSYFMDKENAIA